MAVKDPRTNRVGRARIVFRLRDTICRRIILPGVVVKLATKQAEYWDGHPAASHPFHPTATAGCFSITASTGVTLCDHLFLAGDWVNWQLGCQSYSQHLAQFNLSHNL